jgi:hypothetical protein
MRHLDTGKYRFVTYLQNRTNQEQDAQRNLKVKTLRSRTKAD